MQSQPIHIAFCISSDYIPYITVTIKSIFENIQDDICIHVLIDNISDVGRIRLTEAVNNSQNIKIYVINDPIIHYLKTGVWTIHTWYRVLLPKILPSEIEKVLYLDADTLVTDDLHDLFVMDMTDKAIAAAPDIQSWSKEVFERCGYDMSLQYICTGVMMMNLTYWRKERLSDKTIDWAIKNSERIVCPDQDAINYICRDSKIVLPLRYGILQWFFKHDIFFREPYCEQLKACITNPAIIHFAGCSPWYKDATRHILRKEWIRYNNMLKHPAKYSYYAKGIAVIKIKCWNLLHPFGSCQQLNLEHVKSRLFHAEIGRGE